AMRRHGCLFVLTCHPFLSGRPHRVEVLRGLIEHALAAGDVEFVSCREAARRARADADLPPRPLTPGGVDGAVYPERSAAAGVGAGFSSSPNFARFTNWPIPGSATSSSFSTSTFPRSRTTSGVPVTSVPS